LRYLGPVSFFGILFIFLGLLVFEVTAVPAASTQAAHPKLLRASKSSTAEASTSDVPKAVEPPPVTVAPPGSALYVAKRGDSIPLVARHYLSQTSYLTSSQLSEAIRSANSDLHGTFLKAGQPVIVPGRATIQEPAVETQ